jgi:hypothetical protein
MVGRIVAAAGLLVVLGGCGSSSKPVLPTTSSPASVSGVVRYPWGAPIWPAKVYLSRVGAPPRESCYTDTLGRYRMTVPWSRDSVDLEAGELKRPGRVYAGTWATWPPVIVGSDRDTVVDIWCLRFNPI